MPEYFPQELKRLEMVEAKLQEALKKLIEDVAGYEKEFKDSIRYMADYHNEMDAKEIYSNQRLMDQIESSGNLSIKIRSKIEKLMDIPYFARVDFCYDGDEQAEPLYIGKFSFSDASNQMLIYDWRAPISNIYYDFELGRASFNAPMGLITGDIVLKRQFKIRAGIMEYALESAINIDDDILQKELSHTSDEKMKNIIATIQKEQNLIIRNEKSDVLIIQGVAGSGKTSIALHRVAYLLYQYKDRLLASNIVIISPNKVFADYISNVLPELGEEPIREMSFDDIALDELTGVVEYQRFNEQMDHADPAQIERIQFKSSLSFVHEADAYLRYVSDNYFQPTPYTFGTVTVSAEFILKRYKAYGKRPINKRFDEMADDIMEKIHTESIARKKIPTRNSVIKKLKAMFKMKSTLELYTDFYKLINKPQMFVLAGKNKLEYSDVFAYIYFEIFMEGIDDFETIQHIVIDEMQDYTPVQYAIVDKLFRCKKTILGDFAQSINPYNLHRIEDFKNIFQSIEIVELNKSYRSTYEIIEFAKRIRNTQNIEAINRHGEEPSINLFDNLEQELNFVKESIAAFKAGNYATMGILCKTANQANELYHQLSKEYEIHLLNPDSTKFENGITITTVYMSKGLEFDEVIIPFANTQTYNSGHDRSLLYIACTRAMHRLALSCHGTKTELIN